MSNGFSKQSYVVWRHFVLNTEPDKKSQLDKFSRSDEIALPHKIIGNYQPSTFASKITHNRDFDIYKNFLDLESHKLTALVPEFRFYKVEDKAYTPFYFPQAAEEMSRSSILEVGSTRAVSVQDFGIEYTGRDPATAEKMLNFNMTLYTDNIKNLFLDTPLGYAKIAELFTIYKDKTHLKSKSSTDKKVPDSNVRKARSAEIAAYVGYSLPYNAKEFMTSEEINTIENSKLHLRLTYVRHNIDVEQNGAATVQVQFVGRMFSVLRENSYNLMASKIEIVRLAKTRADLKAATKKPNNAATTAEVQEIKALIATTNRSLVREFVSRLSSKGLLYDYALKHEDIGVFKDYQKRYDESRKKNGEVNRDMPANTLSSLPKSTSQEFNRPEQIDNNSTQVSFFYLGDLISVVAETMGNRLREAKVAIEEEGSKNMKEEILSVEKDIQSLKSMRILMGSALLSIADGEYRSVNLSDIPISLEFFQSYFFNSVENNYTMNYSFAKFLNDCVTTIIPQSLSAHGLDNAKFLHGTVGVKSMEVTGPSLRSNDPEVDITDLPGALSRIPARLKSDETDYFIMYGTHPEDAKLSRRGSRLQDIKNGIYHFYLGRNRGVLRGISFSMMDIKYRKEALMVSSVNLYDQLKMPYNASLDMIGNTAFLPGSLFFIDPSSVGMGNPRDRSSAAFQIGLGGYYQAKSVSISYSNGTLTTRVDAVQVSWAEDEQELYQQLDSYISNKKSPGVLS
jgi:hypothetical protein